MSEGPWLLLSEKRCSKILDQLLTQKEGGDLESGPLWGFVSLSQCWGTLTFIQGTWRGQGTKLPPHPSSYVPICGNSQEGLGPGVFRVLKALEISEREKYRAKDRVMERTRKRAR